MAFWNRGTKRMSFTLFNVDNGFLEAIVRGYRSGLLNTSQYANLAQCETLEGMTVVLIK